MDSSIINLTFTAGQRRYNTVIPEVFDRERIEAMPNGPAEIAIATQAVGLLWSAAGDLGLDITGYCILAGLTLVDILHGLHACDAQPMLCGVEIARSQWDHSVTCGNPKAQRLPKRLNAHIAVRVGNIVVDPVILQMRRPWNDIPHAAILPAFTPAESRSSWMETVTRDFEPVKRFTRGFTKAGFELSYFELPKVSAKRARGWMSLPDANPGRRAVITREAFRIRAGA